MDRLVAPVPSELNRLRWKCRRGMKELDSVLTYYLDHNYEAAPQSEKEAFHTVLDMQDPELYFLILGKTASDDKTISKLISQLQNTPRN